MKVELKKEVFCSKADADERFIIYANEVAMMEDLKPIVCPKISWMSKLENSLMRVSKELRYLSKHHTCFKCLCVKANRRRKKEKRDLTYNHTDVRSGK